MNASIFSELNSAQRTLGLSVDDKVTTILEMRERVMNSRDLAYVPPTVRHLIETEIPQLIALLRESSRR